MYVIEDERIWQMIIDQAGEMEFDWLGTDKLGQVAAFSNFNTGFMPKCVTNSMSMFNDLATLVETMPEVCKSIQVTREKGRYDDWEEYARKGIFGYDNSNIHCRPWRDGYELLCKPSQPINLAAIGGLEKFKHIIPVFDLVFTDFVKFEELKQALVQ